MGVLIVCFAVKAVLRDYPALVAHFTKCACLKTGGRTSTERSKYKGLLTKLNSWFFLSEACLLKDALRCLKQLSLYLQSQEANVLNAASHVDDTINKLQALKLVQYHEVTNMMLLAVMMMMMLWMLRLKVMVM